MNMEINPSEYKILIVDDVMSNVLLLKVLLTNEKFQIATASNGISVRMMYISFFIYGYGLGIITQFSLYPPPSAWYNDTRYSSELPSACVNWFSYVSSERSASSTF